MLSPQIAAPCPGTATTFGPGGQLINQVGRNDRHLLRTLAREQPQFGFAIAGEITMPIEVIWRNIEQHPYIWTEVVGVGQLK